MEFSTDASGIKSLVAFSFQIKVFCSLASKLQEGQQIDKLDKYQYASFI